MTGRPQSNRWLGLAMGLGVVLVVLLQIQAIQDQSLIGDAPYHLVAGHQALRYGQNTLNLEHPPLVKLIAALPLLREEPVAPPSEVHDALATAGTLFDDPDRLERVRWRSRALLALLFGLPLLVASYGLGRHLVSARAGVLLALTLGLSFASLPFLSVVQTDVAVALGFVLTLWMALRYVERPTRWAAIALGAALGLALASKFSGLLAVPTAGLAVALAQGLSLGRRMQRAFLVVGLAVGLPWLTYGIANLDYDSATGRETIRQYCRGEALVTDDRLEPWQDRLLTLEAISPSLSQYATGVLGIQAQNDLGIYPTLAFGQLSSDGRWWYFPMLLLLRTPWILLAATLLAVGLRWWDPPRPLPLRAQPPARRARWILTLTLLVYGGFAVTSSYNLGIRHLLPILPLLYLPAVRWGAKTPLRSLALLCILSVESWLLAPLWMSATGSWWMSEDPARLAMVSGDTEYHQNFLALEAWAEAEAIERFYLYYPLLDAKELAAYSDRGILQPPDPALEPGWHITSILLESHLPAIGKTPKGALRGSEALRALADRWTPLWEALQSRGVDRGPVAGTFRAFFIPPSDSTVDPAD